MVCITTITCLFALQMMQQYVGVYLRTSYIRILFFSTYARRSIQKKNIFYSFFVYVEFALSYHSSEIQGLCLIKCSNKTPCSFLSFSCYFIFSPNECPGLCQHRPGHSLGGKIKQHEMKNEKELHGFSIPKIWQNLKRFVGTFHQA